MTLTRRAFFAALLAAPAAAAVVLRPKPVPDLDLCDWNGWYRAEPVLWEALDDSEGSLSLVPYDLNACAVPLYPAVESPLRNRLRRKP